MEFNKNKIDISKIKVGKVFRLKFKCEDGEVNIPKVLVKNISIDKDTIVIEYEPLVEFEEFNNFIKNQNIKFFNKETNEIILEYKV